MPSIPDALLSLLLSVMLTAIYGAVLRQAEQYKIPITAVTISLLAAVSFACSSRSCLFAGFTGFAYVWAIHSQRKKAVWLVVSLVSLALLTSLYFIRPGSADGRVLIWIICLSMIFKHPFGYGSCGLSNNYMLHQAEFFKNNPDSVFVRYADNIAISYNEFLHITINFGVVGLSCAILILFNVLSTRKDKGRNDALKAGLITYISFSMFSFPLANLYTWTTLFVLLIALQKRFIPKLFNAICIVAIAGGLAYFFKEEHWERTIRDFHCKGYDDEVIDGMLDSPVCFTVYPMMVDMLLQVNGIESSMYYDRLVETAVCNIPSTDSYCRKGDILLSEHHYSQAISCYQEAHSMVPTKLKPLYKEFLLYIDIGDREMATRIGREILNSREKIHSSESVLIKNKIRKQLDEIHQ